MAGDSQQAAQIAQAQAAYQATCVNNSVAGYEVERQRRQRSQQWTTTGPAAGRFQAPTPQVREQMPTPHVRAQVPRVASHFEWLALIAFILAVSPYILALSSSSLLFAFSFLLGLAALPVAWRAKGKIRESDGRLRGTGFAAWGLAISIVDWVIVVIGVVLVAYSRGHAHLR